MANTQRHGILTSMTISTKKQLHIEKYSLPIQVEQDKEGTFTARATGWSACYAQADTLEEVISEVSLVASSLIELYKEEGLKIPLKLVKEQSQKSSTFKLNFPLVISTP